MSVFRSFALHQCRTGGTASEVFKRFHDDCADCAVRCTTLILLWCFMMRKAEMLKQRFQPRSPDNVLSRRFHYVSQEAETEALQWLPRYLFRR